MSEDRVELLIDGRVYAGWTQASVTRAMDAVAGTFALTVTDRWSPEAAPWPIAPGDACEVRVAGEVLIAGYVDLVRSEFAAGAHTLQVQGRDASADLVDCSALHTPDAWRHLDLLQLAQRLAAPFGIPVRTEVEVGPPLDQVKLQHGETVLEALVRHAAMRKVLVMPDGRGGVLLTRTGTHHASSALTQGGNLLAASGTLDASERYSDYVVKGQAAYREDTDGTLEAHVVARAKDAGVARYRPLLIVAESEVTGASAQARATWEANTRLAKSAQATLTVQGWRQQAGGALWTPNLLVNVHAPWLALDGQMLIRQVTYHTGASGTTAKLDVVSPQAYAPEPLDGKKKTKDKTGNAWMAAIGEDVRGG